MLGLSPTLVARADPARRAAGGPLVAADVLHDRRAVEPRPVPLALRAGRRRARADRELSGGTEVGACFLVDGASPSRSSRSRSASRARHGHGRRRRRRQLGARRGRRARLPAAVARDDARVWGDDERYLETYWRRFPGVWTHGDWASIDEDGYWFLHGRSDDTLNIAGKRIGPAELESAAIGSGSSPRRRRSASRTTVKGEVAWIFCVADARRGARRRAAPRSQPRSPARSARRSSRTADLLGRRAAEDALGEDRAARGARAGARQGSGRPVVAREPRIAGGDRTCRLIAGGRSRSSPAAGAASARTSRASSRPPAWRSSSPRARATRSRRSRTRSAAARSSATSRSARTSSAGRGRGGRRRPARRQRRHQRPGRARWQVDPDDWWHTFEVNVLGVYLCCRAVSPGMVERGGGRIVNVASGAAYLPTGCERAPRTRRARRPCTASASAGGRARAADVLVFFDQPGSREDGDDRAHCRRRRCRGRRRSARRGSCAPSRRAELDALAGRYLHAEHDDSEDLIAPRSDEIRGERPERDPPAALSGSRLCFRLIVENRCASHSRRSTRSSATSTATGR